MVAPAAASAAKLEAAKRMYASSDIAYKLAVRENKKNFPHDAELQLHLKALDVSLLADCLVWIPYHRFTDVTRLGQGGFAAVHRATVQWGTKKYFVEYQDMRLGWVWAGRSEPVVKTYAIKEVDVAMAAEIILTAHLSWHDTIPITRRLVGLSWSEPSNRYLMVIETGDGSMEETLISTPPRSWSDVTDKSLVLASQLARCHSLGVLHHGLHSRNVIFCRDSPSLVDIGLGSVIVSLAGSAPGLYGRIAYLPPEVFRGDPYTMASEVYCLGTLLWQMASRVPPRRTAADVEAREDNLREEFVPGMPVEYEDIIKSCWNPEPERRPTAEVVADALKALQLKGLSGAMTAETKEYLAWRREMHVSEVAAGSEAEADDCDFENGRQTSGISLASDDWSRFYSYEELNDIGGEAESSVAIDSVSQR